MQTHFICHICGREYPMEQWHEFNDEALCPSCYDAHTCTCSHCGEVIDREDNAGDDDTPLCQDCYADYYTSCERCGTIIRLCYANYFDNSDDPYCDDCYEACRAHAIHDYYYKPDPIFYGDGSRFFGVELEIDHAGEAGAHAQQLLAIANRNDREYLYCKHDGSLDDGMELVTHPMTLAHHMQAMPWAELMQKAVSMGYRSHQTDTCGLHIHVNRSAFGESTAEQDACIARVLYFFEKHWEELLKFSRRTQRQLDRWASRYGYKEKPREILDEAKKSRSGDRYTCVNLTNYSTIEFRIFRGTLKYNTLIATLQLVNRVCDAALSLSDTQMQEMSWTTFAAGCQEPELVQYLKERRLYINEPVNAEEDY